MKIGYSTLLDARISVAEQSSLLSVSECIDWAPTVTNPKWDLLDERGQATLAISKPISALQSLFFGVEDATFLGDDKQFNIMLHHFEKLILIAKAYNVKYVLWGSPGTRTFTKDLPESAIEQRFKMILSLFEGTEIKLMVEAVSNRFGCEFISTTAQLLTFNKRMAHENLGLHLDTGQMLDEGLDVNHAVLFYFAVSRHLGKTLSWYSQPIFIALVTRKEQQCIVVFNQCTTRINSVRVVILVWV